MDSLFNIFGSLQGLAIVIFVTLLGYGLGSAVAAGLHWLFKRLPFDEMVETWVVSAAQFVFVFGGLISGFSAIGLDIGQQAGLLTGLGLAIGGFISGAFSDCAAGIILLLTRPYQVNDRVTVDYKSGTVVKQGLFRLHLLTPQLENISIPNSKITQSHINNWRGDIRVDITVGVNYGEQDDAVDILNEIVRHCPFRLTDEKYEHLVVNNGNTANGIDYLVAVYVAPENYFKVRFWLNDVILQQFTIGGLTISKNMLEIYAPDGMPFRAMDK